MLQKISIITVVYNDGEHISKTIESVLYQSYKNIEYVIIDGGSTDSTIEEINKYINKIDVFISEKDYGIYDAMNKGIQLCSGDWLLFLNSGDFFHRYDILDLFSCYIEQSENADIIYGDSSVLSEGMEFSFVNKAKDVERIKEGMIFCHQACFIKRTLHQKSIYDLKYRICADYDFLLKSYLDGAKLYKIPEVIVTVSNGGLSDMNRINVFKERLEIKNTLAPSLINHFYFLKSITYLSFVELIKKLIPHSIFEKFYKLKYKIRGTDKPIKFNQ